MQFLKSSTSNQLVLMGDSNSVFLLYEHWLVTYLTYSISQKCLEKAACKTLLLQALTRALLSDIQKSFFYIINEKKK